MTPAQLRVLSEARAKQLEQRAGGTGASGGTTVGTPGDFAQLAALAGRSVRG